MSELNREKQIKEIRKDLIEIFDEEYDKRRIITADFTAMKMSAKGYRKASEVAKDLFADIDKLVSQYSILDISASPVATSCEIAIGIRELKKKYTEGEG